MPVERTAQDLISYEDFEDVALGSLPTGWVVNNHDSAVGSWSVEDLPAGAGMHGDFGKALRGNIASGTGESAILNENLGTSVFDADIQVRLRIDGDVTTSRGQPAIQGRYVSYNNDIQLRAHQDNGDGLGEGMWLLIRPGGAWEHNRVNTSVWHYYPYILRLRFQGTSVRGRMFFGEDGELRADWTIDPTAQTEAGRVGLCFVGGSDSTQYFDEWAVLRTNIVTVAGLPAGWGFDLDPVGDSAVEDGSGVATLDFDGAFGSHLTLRILDDLGAVVETYNATGIWGGDEYLYTAGNEPPETPTITVSEVTGVSAKLTGSPFVDPDGDSHEASRWQVQVAGGDWSAPVVDSDWTDELLEYIATDLTLGTEYQARVAYMDSEGNESGWSTTMFLEGEDGGGGGDPSGDPTEVTEVTTLSHPWIDCIPPSTDWVDCE